METGFNWQELLKTIMEVVVIPAIPVLCAYLIKLINTKRQEYTATSNNSTFNKYLTLLTETITKCVTATNQTYVEALKKAGTFTVETQKIAFQKTYEAVMNVLTDDAKAYLSEAIGDLEEYVTNNIEAEVNKNK